MHSGGAQYVALPAAPSAFVAADTAGGTSSAQHSSSEHQRSPLAIAAQSIWTVTSWAVTSCKTSRALAASPSAVARIRPGR